jgi:hypothetical protein
MLEFACKFKVSAEFYLLCMVLVAILTYWLGNGFGVWPDL